MFPRNTDYLCARVFALDLAGYKRYQCAENQSERADPDPRNQREYIGLNRGAIAVHAGKIDIKIFIRTLPDSNFVRGLAAGFILIRIICFRLGLRFFYFGNNFTLRHPGAGFGLVSHFNFVPLFWSFISFIYSPIPHDRSSQIYSYKLYI